MLNLLICLYIVTFAGKSTRAMPLKKASRTKVIARVFLFMWYYFTNINKGFYMRCFGLILFFSFIAFSDTTYPKKDWETRSPESLGLSSEKVDRLLDASFEDNSTMGAVLIKNGYVVGERYAEGYNENSKGTSWSVAKSYYASLIGIAIDNGEIESLDDKVSKYLPYFTEDRADITIRQVLNMSSGLEYPDNQHENMFFEKDHLAYAKTIKRDKAPDSRFEYNNVNSMLLSDILLRATGTSAKALLKDRVMDPIGVSEYTSWTDNAGNSLSYCCLDMSARNYARFGLLFSRNGKWEDQQLISEDFVNETFQQVWDLPPANGYQTERGYSMHWWISRFDDERKIFNASGKFGQYIFVDREKDVVFVRITKYTPPAGDKQDLGFLYGLSFLGMDNVIALARLLIEWGWLNSSGDIISPATLEEGVSKEFIVNYHNIIDYLTFLEDE